MAINIETIEGEQNFPIIIPYYQGKRIKLGELYRIRRGNKKPLLIPQFKSYKDSTKIAKDMFDVNNPFYVYIRKNSLQGKRKKLHYYLTSRKALYTIQRIFNFPTEGTRQPISRLQTFDCPYLAWEKEGGLSKILKLEERTLINPAYSIFIPDKREHKLQGDLRHREIAQSLKDLGIEGYRQAEVFDHSFKPPLEAFSFFYKNTVYIITTVNDVIEIKSENYGRKYLQKGNHLLVHRVQKRH